MERYFEQRKSWFNLIYVLLEFISLFIQAFGEFWNAKGSWYPTWQAAGKDAALQVDYVRVWAL